MDNLGERSKVIVTGADGFLGNNIVRELLKQGHEVYGFIQNGRNADSLQELPVKLFYGDLCNTKDLVPLFRDCDYIIHTAGITAVWPSRSEISWRVNFTVVKHLVRLARKYHLKRFIHIGTATSFGPGSLLNPGDEYKPYSGRRFGMDYLDSKFSAQEFLLQEAKVSNFPVIILNPTFMLGSFDSGNGSNKMIIEIYQKNLPGYSRGGKNYVHVKDVATAAVNAMHMGRIGECYIVGNRNMSYKEAFRMIAETIDVPAPKIPIPSLVAITYGALNEFISWLSRNNPVITMKMARIAGVDYYYTPLKAIRELDLPQTPVEIAVRESFCWFKMRGNI